MHESILVYRSHRYLKVAVLVAALSVAAYALHRPLGPPNGGTWLGYTLGTIAGGLIIWLAWFGVRKRKYAGSKLPLEDWLSAHVYLGLALVLVATLHAGFQLGWNIHSVLYVLMVITILSGAFGLYFYMRYPRMLTENRRGLSTELMLSQLADLDGDIRTVAMGLDDEINAAALRATQETVIGGTLYEQLRGFDHDCPTTDARHAVEHSGSSEHDGTKRRLLTLLVRKEELLMRIRRDVQLRSLLRIWLYVHVPFSVATLVALAVHILTVFYYW